MSNEPLRFCVYIQASLPLLEAIVFLDEVQVVATNDDSAVHFCGNHDPSEALSNNSLHDFASDAHIASEGAFLVHVGAILCVEWGLKAETHVSEVANASLGFFTLDTSVEVMGSILLLEGSFGLRFKLRLTWCKSAILSRFSLLIINSGHVLI